MVRKLAFTIDMSPIKKGRREQVAMRLGDAVVQYLEQLYPASEGYTHKKIGTLKSEKNTEPRTFLDVWRGRSWGYTVRLSAPVDYKDIRADLYPFNKLSDILVWCALVAAIVIASSMYFAGILTEFGGAVMAAIGLWVALGVIAWYITHSLVWVSRDKGRLREEMERMFEGTLEVLVRELSSNPDDLRKMDEEVKTPQILASPPQPSESKKGPEVCLKCGFDNLTTATTCRVCGAQLSAP